MTASNIVIVCIYIAFITFVFSFKDDFHGDDLFYIVLVTVILAVALNIPLVKNLLEDAIDVIKDSTKTFQ